MSQVRKLGVFSCGPPSMTKTVDKACLGLNKVTLNGPVIQHHFKNFWLSHIPNSSMEYLTGNLQKNFLHNTFIRIDLCFHSVNTLKWYYINYYIDSPATKVHMPFSFYYYYKGIITHTNMSSGSYIKRSHASELLWSTRYQWHLCLELDRVQGLQ